MARAPKINRSPDTKAITVPEGLALKEAAKWLIRQAESEDEWTAIHHVMPGNPLDAAIAVARRQVPEGPLFVAGHSIGGHIASLYAARQAHLGADDSHRLSGLILIASGVPFHRLYRGGSGLRASLGPLAMYRISHAVGFWPGTVVEGYGRQSRVLIRDWTYLNRHGRFSPRGPGTAPGE